jgi:hypothetical protein
MKGEYAMSRVGLASITCFLLSIVSFGGSLEEGFRNPSREAGIRCWWWWLNGNVTREAITRDLEAMQDKGFSGALIFDAGGADQRGNQQVPAGPVFASKEWIELLAHAVSEADRLDLELGMSIQSGWNLGGPGIMPEMAAKQLTWSEIEVEGPATHAQTLPEPRARDGYYRDIAVLAFPVRKHTEGVAFAITASSSQSQYAPEAAIDRNFKTFWVSGGTKAGQGPSKEKPEWLQISFDNPTAVSGLAVIGRRGYGPRQCRLEARPGNGPYSIVHSFELSDGREYEATFDAIMAGDFRLLIMDAYDVNSPGAPRNVQIAELMLLNDEGRNVLPKGRSPIRDLTLKASFRELGGSATDCRFLLNDDRATENEEDATTGQIVDLTGKLDPPGRLNWEVPAGTWCILRFGYTCNGAHVSTCSQGWNGRVLDYLSEESMNAYLKEVVEPVLKALGPSVGTSLKYLQTDSWECGGMNWTERFPKEFKKFRGYDPIPYLPVISGKIIEDRQTSNRFLADFRKTISDCIAFNHYQVFADFAHRYNMGIQPESGGPHAGPFDGMKNLGRNDIAMSEFWAPSPHRPKPENRFFVKQASSVAHIYGKKLIGAESFTTIGPHWDDVLWKMQKPSLDHEFCSGLNIVYLHTFTCSPPEMGLPGQEYFAGTHFNPQVTWWNHSDGFIDYMMRCQYLLQQGAFVADVLYYYGDHVPNIARLKEDDPAKVLPGYDYDVTNEEILLQLKVLDGDILVPGGIRYPLLVLPDHKVLSLAALEKVATLLRQGATIVGGKPERLVSLVGGKSAQVRFKELADSIWGSSPDPLGRKKSGKGTIFWGLTGRQVLQEMDILPDFEVKSPSNVVIDYIHYKIQDGHVYFVSNQSEESIDAACIFRINGRQPELWDPLTGDIRKAQAFHQQDERTTLPLLFPPYGSLFVVFKRQVSVKTQGTMPGNFAKSRAVQTIDGPWNVRFDPAWGGPGQVVFEDLISWTRSSDKGIRFYSGTATYENTFTFANMNSAKRYWLDLGEIRDVGIAKVWLNEEDLGTIWTKPFSVEVTEALKSGHNKIRIDVVNCWRNRLIGDRDIPLEQRYTRTNITVRKDWQVLESGLLGPVRILQEK